MPVILYQPTLTDGSFKVSENISGGSLDIYIPLNAKKGKRKKEITCSLSNQAAALGSEKAAQNGKYGYKSASVTVPHVRTYY